MELKEGMYVRTRKGIGKVVEHKKLESWGYLVKIIGQYSCYTHTSNGELTDVIKASYNPIDLIEVGDYVNGKKVDKIAFVDGEYYIKTKVSNTGNYDYLPEHLIENIVTKEQFERIAYKVEKE